MTTTVFHAAPTPPGAGIFLMWVVPRRSRWRGRRGAVDAVEPLLTSATAPPQTARHLLGLQGMTRDELLVLLAESARERTWLAQGEPNRTDLAGMTVVLAFIEDSTRTRTSFEIAAQRLGANAVVFSSAAQLTQQGRDAARHRAAVRGHGRGAGGGAPPLVRRAGLARAATRPHGRGQRRRRDARASDPGAPGPAHAARCLGGPLRGTPAHDRGRHRALARGALGDRRAHDARRPRDRVRSGHAAADGRRALGLRRGGQHRGRARRCRRGHGTATAERAHGEGAAAVAPANTRACGA